MGIVQKYRNFEKGHTLPKPLDLSNPDHRARAMHHFDWADHGVLRRRWTNFYELAPGVYRANQPSPGRFAEYAKLGLKTVINLRGAEPSKPHYLFELEARDKHGFTLIDIPLRARTAPPKDSILDLIAAFRSAEKPLLMHCKSGADRAGLASAIYLLVIEGKPMAEAKKMLSFRFLHVKWHTTGVLGYFLDVYAARNARAPIAFEDWVRDEYDQSALNAGFKNGRKVPQ